MQWILYVSAQMAGGIIAFPLLQSLSSPYGVKIGGPGIQPGVELSEAAMSEGLATLLLLMGIFLFATTHIGKYYPVKQPLIAGVIRLCIVQFGKTVGTRLTSPISPFLHFSDHPFSHSATNERKRETIGSV